jgi:uncharacterized protein YuzE
MIDSVKLWHLLNQTFSAGDLKGLCFELAIDYDDVEGNTRSEKARELITYCSRRGRVEDLLAKAQELRPHLNWTAETGSTPSEQAPAPQPALPSLPDPAPARAGALAALREFRGYLDEAWNVFINQNNYRNQLYRLIKTELPHIASRSIGYDQTFYDAYPELPPTGRELFATVRRISEANAYQANNRIREWIRNHPLDNLLPERTPAAVELEKQVGLLALHLKDWFAIYEEEFLPNERRTLVYAGDERRLGQPWPRGVEPAVDAMIAELSRGDMRVVYDRRTDALTLVFSDAPAAESAEGKPGVLLDYDVGGNLVSLKILEASRRVTVPARVSYETF